MVVLLFAFTTAQRGTAADAPEYGPAPNWVAPAVVPRSPTTPAASPLRVLLQDQQARFTASGQEFFVEQVICIQTPQGLQGLGTLQLQWKPDTDNLTIHKVQVLRGDQVIDLLADGTKFTLLRRENNLEYSALDGVLTAVLQPTDLRVGDVVDLAYSVKRSDPVLAGTAEALLGGWVQFPISHVHMRARWPRSNAIRWRATDDVKPREQRDGDYLELSYDLDNVEPPAQPTGAPRRFAVMRKVEFSSFASWSAVSRLLAPLYARAAALSADSPLQQEVGRIKTSTAEPTARAAAALMLVEDSVRYVYLGMNEGGLVPAAAGLTWSRRFGDCKAKSALLLALLHELGIEAEAVAVNTRDGDGLDERLPMISAFDHVIVRVHIGGQVYWLDATRSGDRHLESLKAPNYYRGLPLVPGGSELIPIVAASLTEPTSDTKILIDASAGIHAPAHFHVSTVLSGDAATLINLQLSSLSGDTLDGALREYWSKQYDFVEVKSVVAHYDPEAGTETLGMDGTARQEWKDNWYETDGLSLGYDAHFSRPPGANQSAPYAVAFPLYSRTSEKILLPPGQPPFTVRGSNIDRVVGGIEYRRQAIISAVDGSFTGEASSRSIQPEFPAADAASVQQALRAMAKDTLYVRCADRYFYTEQDVRADMARTLTSASEYIDRGNMLLDHRRYDVAIADFNKALELDPKADMALADRGLAYLWEQKPERALEDWKAAEAINPHNAVVFRGRGVVAVHDGKYDDGIRALTTSLQFEPTNGFAHRWRARAYAMTEHWAEAIADSTEVISTAPDIDMYHLRASAYVRTGQIDSALADALAVTKMPGAGAPNYRTAAAIYNEAGRQPEAFQAYSKVLELEPEVDTYLRRAGVRPVGDLAGRQSDADAALKLNPHSSAALTMRAWAQYQGEKYAEAAESTTAAIEEHSTPELLIIRGAAYAKSGQAARSHPDIVAARKLAGTDAGALNDLCWLLGTYNLALTDALAACDQAISKAPNNAAYLDSRGFILLRLGRNGDAIAAYDAALRIRPHLGPSLYGRGLAKLRSGDPDGGNADIQAAIAEEKTIPDWFTSYGVKP